MLASTAELIFSWEVASTRSGGGTFLLERTAEQTGLEITEDLTLVGKYNLARHLGWLNSTARATKQIQP
jgi:hypothetical protein